MPNLDGLLASLLPDRAAAALTRRLLKVQGIGAGTRAAAGGEAKALARAIGTAQRPVLFDVGANVGEWTRAAKQVCPGAIIHAFEPSQIHRTHFTSATKTLSDVTLAPFGLSDQSTTATLYKDSEITGLASLTQRDLREHGLRMDRTETVQLERLDSYMDAHQIPRIDFLKIDVEGHELDVLKGAEAALKAGRIQAVQFEFGGCNIDTRTYLRDFVRLFESYDMRLHRIRPNGVLQPLGVYRSYHEQFSTTNFVALK